MLSRLYGEAAVLVGVHLLQNGRPRQNNLQSKKLVIGSNFIKFEVFRRYTGFNENMSVLVEKKRV